MEENQKGVMVAPVVENEVVDAKGYDAARIKSRIFRHSQEVTTRHDGGSNCLVNRGPVV
jgi:hypothetical protein